MQQKKYLNQKNFYKSKTGRFSNKFKFDKSLKFFRKILKYKTYAQKLINKINNKKIFTHKLNVIITSNNIFCCLSKLNNKILKTCSSGKYKIKTSKKSLKHTFSLVLNNFLFDISRGYNYKGIIINITSPIKIRKKIINSLSFALKKTPLLIKVLKKKSFNGCRPPKKIRKKRRGMKILK
jgi:ribosomal protein S11